MNHISELRVKQQFIISPSFTPLPPPYTEVVALIRDQIDHALCMIKWKHLFISHFSDRMIANI